MPEFHGQANKDAHAHALAIGHVVMAWNEYHETLGQIYAELRGRDSWQDSLNRWQKIRSDTQQRKLLRDVVEGLSGRAHDEIVWMLDQTDYLVSTQRNVGVHAPLMSFTDLDGKHQMLPQTMFGNQKAAALVGKDILQEYGQYEIRIRKLLTFAISIQFNISPVRVGPECWQAHPSL